MNSEQQMQTEADKIRANWLDRATAPTDPLTAYIANTTAQRPLGPNDTGMLQALGYYGTSPSTMSRDQKLERQGIIRHLRHPDPTGLSGPDPDALNRHPDLRGLWNGRTDEDPAVRDRAQQEIYDRSHPSQSDPELTAVFQRFAAKKFSPIKAPRS